jgi:hypothetical protein
MTGQANSHRCNAKKEICPQGDGGYESEPKKTERQDRTLGEGRMQKPNSTVEERIRYGDLGRVFDGRTMRFEIQPSPARTIR